MKRQAVILCPGRGSYTAASLGYLCGDAPAAARAALDAAVDRSDGLRTARGDLTIRSMDGARKFKSSFLQGENSAGLTFACTAFDALRLDRSALEPVAVAGNSMGWYSALFAAGVFGLDDAFDLIESMGGMTRDGAIGGQLIYPVVDDDWRQDTERLSAVKEALRSAQSAGSEAGHSIYYGGFAVLWADEPGLERLEAQLPTINFGENKYPLTLLGHSAFHSPLMLSVSQRAVDHLSSLPWRAPEVPLIDGRGARWLPLTADPDALRSYTLGPQVTELFDFSAAVRVALREYAPDCLVLLGPGDTMGSAVAQVMIAERWQGISSRAAFLERQASDPFVLSMARDEQARLVTVPAGEGSAASAG